MAQPGGGSGCRICTHKSLRCKSWHRLRGAVAVLCWHSAVICTSPQPARTVSKVTERSQEQRASCLKWGTEACRTQCIPGISQQMRVVTPFTPSKWETEGEWPHSKSPSKEDKHLWFWW